MNIHRYLATFVPGVEGDVGFFQDNNGGDALRVKGMGQFRNRSQSDLADTVFQQRDKVRCCVGRDRIRDIQDSGEMVRTDHR